MKINTIPLEVNHFYHIYNKGINGGQLFFESGNYFYFLKLISEKIKPVARIYSYCLLQSHFHLLVVINNEETIRLRFPDKSTVELEKIISQQFSNTFNSYSQAINKRFGRTGKLFELPFRRKEILTDQQLINSILYINKNPEKHKISDDYLNYPYSSVKDISIGNNFLIESREVLKIFNGVDNFLLKLNEYEV